MSNDTTTQCWLFEDLAKRPATVRFLKRYRERTRVCLREVTHPGVRVAPTIGGVEKAAVQDLSSMVSAGWSSRGSAAGL